MKKSGHSAATGRKQNYKQSNQPSYMTPTATPFDDTFRTLCQKLTKLLIPVINELFGTDHEISVEKIERLANEFYDLPDAKNHKIPKRITDSCIKIDGTIYHIECQSTADGKILLRLVEYDLKIAYAHINHQDAKNRVTVDIPVLNVGSYSIGDIVDKNLLLLVPYYILKYENTIKRIAQNPLEMQNEYDRIVSEIENFSNTLSEYGTHFLTEYEFSNLISTTKFIIMYISDKLDADIRERLVNTMDGNILLLPTDFIEMGEKRGEKRGKRLGEKKLARLMSILLSQGRTDDAMKATTDKAVRESFYKEFDIQ